MHHNNHHLHHQIKQLQRKNKHPIVGNHHSFVSPHGAVASLVPPQVYYCVRIGDLYPTDPIGDKSYRDSNGYYQGYIESDFFQGPASGLITYPEVRINPDNDPMDNTQFTRLQVGQRLWCYAYAISSGSSTASDDNFVVMIPIGGGFVSGNWAYLIIDNLSQTINAGSSANLVFTPGDISPDPLYGFTLGMGNDNIIFPDNGYYWCMCGYTAIPNWSSSCTTPIFDGLVFSLDVQLNGSGFLGDYLPAAEVGFMCVPTYTATTTLSDPGMPDDTATTTLHPTWNYEELQYASVTWGGIIKGTQGHTLAAKALVGSVPSGGTAGSSIGIYSSFMIVVPMPFPAQQPNY